MKIIFPLLAAFVASGSLCAAEVDSVKVNQIEQVEVKIYRMGLLKSNIPSLLQVVSKVELKRTTALSVNEAIRSVAIAESADVQGLTGGIELRGFAPSASGTNTYTLLLQDGIRMGTRNAATTFLSGINSIEIVKGPFSALYGSGAMGGVINIISSESKGKIAGGVDLSYGSYNTLSVGASVGGSLSKKFDFDLILDYFKRSGDYKTGNSNALSMSGYDEVVLDPNSYNTVYPNTSFDKKRGVLRIGYDISKRWRLNLFNDIYLTCNASSNGMLWGFNQSDKRVSRNFHRIDLLGNSGAHTIRVTPYFSWETSDYKNHDSWGDSRSEYQYNSYGIAASDAIKIGSSKLLFGLDNFSERYNSTQALMDGTPQAPYQPDYSASHTGLFAQFHLSLFEGRFTTIAGIRYDNILFRTYQTKLLENDASKQSYNSVNPNISMQFRPVSTLRIHAGVGKAFLAPDGYKMTGQYTNWGTTYIGNPNLKPEVAVTWEAGVGYISKNGALESDISLFFTSHDNLAISKRLTSTTVSYFNAKEASINGLEAMVSLDLGRAMKKSFSWKIYASLTRMFKAEVETESQTAEHRYLSRTKFNLGTTFSHSKFALGLDARYVGSKIEDNWIYSTDYNTGERVPFTTTSGVRVRPSLINDELITNPANILFNAFASWNISPKIYIMAKAANILNELYMERDGYYMPGRNFTLSVNVTF